MTRPGTWHSEDDRERGTSKAAARGTFTWPPRATPAAPPAPVSTDPVSIATTHQPAHEHAHQAAQIPIQASTPDHHNPATVWLGQIREPLHDRLTRAGLNLAHPAPYCPRCGISVSPGEVAPDDPSSGCHGCNGTNLAWDRFVRLGEYEGELRRVVLDIKFGRWRELGSQMGQMAGAHLATRLNAAGLGHLPIVLVPIPMHLLRRVMRGVDHTQAICRGVRVVTGATVIPALRSTSWRTTQLDVIASQREAHARASIARSYWPQPQRLGSALAKGGIVVVVDDVKTTGSTMHAACRRVRELLKSRQLVGYRTIQVWGMSLAVTQPGGHSGGGSMGE